MPHHVLKHIVAGIAVVALCEDTHLGHQGGIEGLLLGIGQAQLGVEQTQFRTVVRTTYLCHGRLFHALHLDAAETGEHGCQHALLRLQAGGLLHRIQPFGLHVLPVALGGSTALHHRGQLALVAAQQLLQIAVQPQLFVEQQEREIHLVHPLAHLVEAHLVLGRLHVTLFAGNGFLTVDGSAVVERLVDVDAHAPLVFLQSFHVEPHLLVQALHLVGPRHHVALQGGLCRRRYLRQPSLLDIGHCQRRRFLNEAVLAYQRIVLLRCLLAFLQGLGLRGYGQHRHGNCENCFLHNGYVFGFSVAKIDKKSRTTITLSGEKLSILYDSSVFSSFFSRKCTKFAISSYKNAIGRMA